MKPDKMKTERLGRLVFARRKFPLMAIPDESYSVDLLPQEAVWSIGTSAGIDLGTSGCSISVFINGEPEVLPNREGEKVTPTVVAYSGEVDGSVSTLVGKPALDQACSNPENTFVSVKRLVGRQASELSDIELERRVAMLYQRLYCPLLDRVIAPQDILSQVLKKVSGDASDLLGPPRLKDVVITVPASFNEMQRSAIKGAGKAAGLNVLRIISDTEAVILSLGLLKEATQIALIFDFGGGSLDVSIVKVGEETFEVLATSGDTELGGDDFDRCISDWMIGSFEREYGVDLSEDPLAMQRVTTASEKIKIELSSLSQAGAELPFIAEKGEESLHLSLQLTRESFESMCKELLDRCRSPLEQALKDAGMTPDDINQVVTVGGSSRIPMVNRLVEEMMGRPPVEPVNPEEAVAVGAALLADVLEEKTPTNVVLRKVIPSLSLTLAVYFAVRLLIRLSG